MLPTPSTSHISFTNIYEPAEDSYLLLDTLSSTTEISFLKRHFPASSPAPLILEVGTGSGVVLAFVGANASYIFDRSDLALLGTDINILATRASHATASRAIQDVHPDSNDSASLLGIVTADLAGPVRHHQVDVLIFNPPYVPTETVPGVVSVVDEKLSSHEIFQRDSVLLELSYAGGIDGMETTYKLIDDLPNILSSRGVAYILLCAQNRPELVKAYIKRLPGSWNVETVGTSGNKAGWERLCIIRVWR